MHITYLPKISTHKICTKDFFMNMGLKKKRSECFTKRKTCDSELGNRLEIFQVPRLDAYFSHEASYGQKPGSRSGNLKLK